MWFAPNPIESIFICQNIMQSSKKLYKFPGRNKEGVQHASTTTYVWLSNVAAWTVNKEWFGGNSFPWGHNDESSHYLADLAAAAAKATSSKCCFLRHTLAAVALQHRKRTVQIFFCVCISTCMMNTVFIFTRKFIQYL